MRIDLGAEASILGISVMRERAKYPSAGCDTLQAIPPDDRIDAAQWHLHSKSLEVRDAHERPASRFLKTKASPVANLSLVWERVNFSTAVREARCFSTFLTRIGLDDGCLRLWGEWLALFRRRDRKSDAQRPSDRAIPPPRGVTRLPVWSQVMDGWDVGVRWCVIPPSELSPPFDGRRPNFVKNTIVLLGDVRCRATPVRGSHEPGQALTGAALSGVLFVRGSLCV